MNAVPGRYNFMAAPHNEGFGALQKLCGIALNDLHEQACALRHETLGALLIKGDLKQRIAAHRLDGNDHAVSECTVADTVSGCIIRQGNGGLCRCD